MGAILHLHSVFGTPQLTVCRASLACIQGQLRNNPLTLWECTRNSVGCSFSHLHLPTHQNILPCPPQKLSTVHRLVCCNSYEVFIEFDRSLLLFWMTPRAETRDVAMLHTNFPLIMYIFKFIRICVYILYIYSVTGPLEIYVNSGFWFP